MDCKSCKTRHRADKLIEDFGANPAGWDFKKMKAYIDENGINCPNCSKHDFTDIRTFNLMFKTFQGVTEDSKNELYLIRKQRRGFSSILPMLKEHAEKIPFGIAQIGKSFRNEITSEILFSALVNLSRWSLSFSANPAPTLNGFHTGRISA